MRVRERNTNKDSGTESGRREMKVYGVEYKGGLEWLKKSLLEDLAYEQTELDYLLDVEDWDGVTAQEAVLAQIREELAALG